MDKSAFLAIAERGFKTATVAVPEWSTATEEPITVKVRELSADEFKKVGQEMGGREGQEAVNRAMDYVYDVVVWCTLGDDDEQVFSEGDQAELKKAAKTSTFYQGLARIANEVFSLSGLGEEEEESPN